MSSPEREQPRVRKEYLVLVAVVVLLSWTLVSWCGPTLKRWLSLSLPSFPHAQAQSAKAPSKKAAKKASPAKRAAKRAAPLGRWQPMIPLTLDGTQKPAKDPSKKASKKAPAKRPAKGGPAKGGPAKGGPARRAPAKKDARLQKLRALQGSDDAPQL